MINCPFPTHALPSSIQQAILEVTSVVKAPPAIAVASALSSISLACQTLANVRRPNGTETPISLNLLTFAESGERKSTTDRFFSKAIHEFEDAQEAAALAKLESFEFENMVWDTKRRALLDEIKKAASTYQETDDFKVMLKTVMDHRPKRPEILKLIYRDVTPEALAASLKQWRSGGISSDEGGALFESRTFNNLCMLNVLWDGGSLIVDRKNSTPLKVDNARLTISLLVQPSVFCKFSTGKGALVRGSGALARYLVSYPPSTQGWRQEIDQPPVRMDALDEFNKRIVELLRSSMSPDGKLLPNKVLELSLNAQREYVIFINDIEQKLLPGGYLSDVKDAASKIGDNMCRIAGLFHCFEGKDGPIDLETICRAIEIAKWYIFEFKRLFGVQPQAPQEQQDAMLLEAWLSENYRLYGYSSIKKNLIRQMGPNCLRKRDRLEAALHVLLSLGRIKIGMLGKTSYVMLPS